MFIFNSSIGKKFIQAVSGAFLIIFMLLHASINFLSVLDSFNGTYGAEDGLFKMGCDFMALPIVTVMVPVLALGFIVHILYGCYLTWQNIRARGGYNRYEVASKAAADSWSAKNMLVLGIVILGLLFFHLTHFWAKMQLAEFTGGEALGRPLLHRVVHRHLPPHGPRFLEHVPDGGLEQHHLDEAHEGDRHHRCRRHRADVYLCRLQRLSPGQRIDWINFFKFFLQF